MPTGLVPDFRKTSLHRADQIVEIAAEVVREQPVGTDDRDQLLKCRAVIVCPASCVADHLQHSLHAPEGGRVAVTQLARTIVLMGKPELLVRLRKLGSSKKLQRWLHDLRVNVLAINSGDAPSLEPITNSRILKSLIDLLKPIGRVLRHAALAQRERPVSSIGP